MTPTLTGMQQQKYRRKTLSSGIGGSIDAFPDAGILLFMRCRKKFLREFVWLRYSRSGDEDQPCEEPRVGLGFYIYPVCRLCQI